MGKIAINETASKKSTEAPKKESEKVSAAKKPENSDKKSINSEKTEKKTKPAAEKTIKTEKKPQTEKKTQTEKKSHPVQKIVIAHFDATEKVELAETEKTDTEKPVAAESVKLETEKIEVKDAEKTDDKLQEVAKAELTGVISALEVERLSDSADVLAGANVTEQSETEVKEVETETKPSNAKSAKQITTGTVMDFRASSARAARVDELDDEVEPKAKVATEPTGQPKFSKPKAALMAVGVAIIVGLIGGVIIWLMGRKEIPQCVVQFESNGGTAVEDQTMACGKVISRPDDPTKDGFDFKGWIYEGEPFDFKTMKAGRNMILQAMWTAHENTETVIVKFNADGGSAIAEIEVKKGSTIPKAPVSSRSGYRLVGWYTDTNDEFREFIFGKDKVEANMTLVALWEKVRVQTPSQGGNETPAEEPKEEAKLEISVSETSALMRVGETREFSVLVQATPKDLEYRTAVSVMSEGVLSCSKSISEGKVVCSAIGAGEDRVTIVARGTAADGSSVVASQVINISVLAVPVESVAITGAPSEAQNVGAVITLGATVLPLDATNRRVTWTSSNENLVKVEGGKATIVGQADEETAVTITAMAGDKTTTVTIKVAAKPAVEQPPVITPLEVSSSTTMVTAGETATLSANKDNVVWSIEEGGDVASIDGNTVTVSASAAADTRIVIKAESGDQVATVTITVVAAAGGGNETPGENLGED